MLQAGAFLIKAVLVTLVCGPDLLNQVVLLSYSVESIVEFVEYGHDIESLEATLCRHLLLLALEKFATLRALGRTPAFLGIDTVERGASCLNYLIFLRLDELAESLGDDLLLNQS